MSAPDTKPHAILTQETQTQETQTQETQTQETQTLGGQLLRAFQHAGYQRREPAILQQAQVFLEVSGEDMRRHLLLVSNPALQDVCLRPDYTIPACLDYVAAYENVSTAAPELICYLGPVFQMRESGAQTDALQSHAFYECGLENFGRIDLAKADADIVHLAVSSMTQLMAMPLLVRMGDAGLLTAFLEALEFPPVFLRLIRRAIKQNLDVGTVLAQHYATDKPAYLGVLAALDGQDKAGARALTEDLLAIAGIVSVGGRSAGEIAERFLEKAALSAGSASLREKQKLLQKFLEIKAPLPEALTILKAFLHEAGLAGKLEAALTMFAARQDALQSAFADKQTAPRLVFETSFARNFDYYSGLVFEAVQDGVKNAPALLGGGRYDGLITKLSKGKLTVPAVGAAIFLDRLNAMKAGEA